MRRMLDPKEAGGNLPSTIQFDAEGNRTASKDVKVDGKLKLKSLVSESNPDGDITKELGGGGGKTYLHSITISSSSYDIYINIYSNSNTTLTLSTFEELVRNCGKVICTGFYNTSTTYGIANYIAYSQYYQGIKLYYFDTQDKMQKETGTSSVQFKDTVAEVV